MYDLGFSLVSVLRGLTVRLGIFLHLLMTVSIYSFYEFTTGASNKLEALDDLQNSHHLNSQCSG